MKTLAALLLAAALAGCATAPLPQSHIPPHKRVAAPKTSVVVPAAVVEQTPNQIVKHRWYDRFKVHPSKWFHKR